MTKKEEKTFVVHVKVKKVSRKKAKRDILDYIENHEGCLTSTLIQELEYDPLLVVSILEELKEEDEVSNRPNQ